MFLQVLVLASLFTFIFLISFWFLSKSDLKRDTVFDVAFISILFGFLAARILGVMLYFTYYRDHRWDILPIKDEFGLLPMPWVFLNVFDGNIVFLGLLVGVVLGLLVLYINSNKQKSIFFLFDRVVLVYLISSLFLLLGLFLLKLAYGAETDTALGFVAVDSLKRYPIPLFQAGYCLLLLLIRGIFYRFFKNTQGVFTSIAFIVIGLTETFLRTFQTGYTKAFFDTFDLYQIIAIIITIAGIFLLINISNLNIFNINFKKKQDMSMQDRINLRRERILRNTNIGSSYNVSFASREEGLPQKLTISEHVSKFINSRKRRK